MKILLSLILAWLSLTINLALAEPFKPMSTPYAGKGKAKFTVIGADKNKGSFVKPEKLQSFEEQTIEIVTQGEREYYQIKETMKLFNDQQVETTSLIEIGEYLKPISYNLIRRNPRGEVIEKWEFRFDDASWNYADDTYCTPALTLIILSFIDHEMEEASFHFWQNDQTIVRMKLKLKGKEQVRISAGEVSCYKIRMVVDVQSVMPVGKFLAFLIQPFMPESHFWVTEKEPRYIVKSEVALGQRGSPSIAGETVEIEFQGSVE